MDRTLINGFLVPSGASYVTEQVDLACFRSQPTAHVAVYDQLKAGVGVSDTHTLPRNPALFTQYLLNAGRLYAAS